MPTIRELENRRRHGKVLGLIARLRKADVTEMRVVHAVRHAFPDLSADYIREAMEEQARE